MNNENDTTTEAGIILGPRFEDALAYAAGLHAKQTRKGGSIPYVSHLIAVCSLVLEAGGDEEMAIAALLHDAVEDQGGLSRLEEIGKRYGERVAGMVDACTDSYDTPKPPWRERKEAYLAAVADKSMDAMLVSCADKLHNARCILSDYRRVGDELWARFSADKDGVLWYYESLALAFAQKAERAQSEGGFTWLAEELRRTVCELKEEIDEMSSNRITNIFVDGHYKILSLWGVVLAVSAVLNATAVIAISSDFFWCMAGLALAFEGYIDHTAKRQREERQAGGAIV